MEYKLYVIASYDIYVIQSGTFSKKTVYDVFNSMEDVVNYLRSLDYPFTKISIHVLTH